MFRGRRLCFVADAEQNIEDEQADEKNHVTVNVAPSLSLSN